jgi:2-amino-4-hydroxy-6-hydroxymethyldihydropteridine diphosphokinase
MYVIDQPRYLNAVGEAFSGSAPREMLSFLHRIEQSLGRDRAQEIRMGPRTLDLDILLCGSLVMDDPGLTIPHPRLAERLFVLVPLLEIAPDLRDPRTGAPYSRALAELVRKAGSAEAGGVYLYPPR